MIPFIIIQLIDFPIYFQLAAPGHLAAREGLRLEGTAMRLFFALDLPPAAKLKIDAWRDRSFRELSAGGIARPVHPGNFHITLAFIGDVDERKLESLCDSVDQWLEQAPPAQGSLSLNQVGYWQRQGILWLGPEHCPDSLTQLAGRLQGLSRRTGGKCESKKFTPHVTLFRRCKVPPPSSLQPPEVRLDYAEFALFESSQGKQGVRYQALQFWSCCP